MSDEHPQEPGSDEFSEGGAPEEPVSPSDEAGPPPPVTQSEVDDAFAKRAPDPEPSHTLANLPKRDAPLIEKEPITDPELLDILLRPEDLSRPSPAPDAGPKDPKSVSRPRNVVVLVVERRAVCDPPRATIEVSQQG